MFERIAKLTIAQDGFRGCYSGVVFCKNAIVNSNLLCGNRAGDFVFAWPIEKCLYLRANLAPVGVGPAWLPLPGFAGKVDRQFIEFVRK